MAIFEYMSLFRRISGFFEAQLSEKRVSDQTFLQRERFKAIFGIQMTSRELQVQVEQKNGITLLKA